MSECTERWLPIARFEGLYEVSSLGQVRSLDRIVVSRNQWGPTTTFRRGQILAQRIDADGYLTVGLHRNGKARPYRVHRLVGEAFFGPRPAGMDTLHGPAGRLVNSTANLRYGTRAENEQDKIRDGTFRHGGSPIGEANQNARLTAAIVVEIRQLYASGQRQVALGQAYGVSTASISNIVRRKTWKHIPAVS